ncbi:hypothetical protein [Azospirillum soli]|uniref:hypothetical protein n=1 Tax=Azospirillum soli TaxID=1304799 RepID=UPI001AE79EA2|nr:hypothetical protein [Azospirillum soli]MBP2315520.1 hypothetical protein [Azospirillum soli]
MAQLSRTEQRKVNEVADYLRGLDAATAAAIAPRLTAGLSAGASAGITRAAEQRVRGTRDLSREWAEADTRQRALENRRLDEFRGRQQAQRAAQARRERDLQIWLLFQQIDDLRRMSDRQATAHFRAAMVADQTWPAAREALRTAMITSSTEAFLDRKREAALANGTPLAGVETFDAVRHILSSDTVKGIIREALMEARPADDQPQAAAEKAVAARETIETRLMQALDAGNAPLSLEQRAAFETSIRGSLADHFREFGLGAGVPVAAAEIEAHAEALRGRITTDLADLLMDDGLGLDAQHYCAMLTSINTSISALTTLPAAEREAAANAMMIDHQRKMIGSGLDPSGCSPETIMAQAARSMYEVAARTLSDPAVASQEDLDMARALAEIAQRRPEMDLQPAAPALTVGGVLDRLHQRRAAALDQSADLAAEETMRPR